MPWTASDAKGHTKKAATPKAKRQWAHVANGELAAGKSDGEAVRIANGVVKRRKPKSNLHLITA